MSSLRSIMSVRLSFQIHSDLFLFLDHESVNQIYAVYGSRALIVYAASHSLCIQIPILIGMISSNEGAPSPLAVSDSGLARLSESQQVLPVDIPTSGSELVPRIYSPKSMLRP